MEINKYHILIIIIEGIGILGMYEVNKSSIEKSYFVVENKIKEAGKKCFLEEKCPEEFTLNDLFEKGYINEAVDPITKEDIDKNKCLKYENNEIIFCK